MRQEIQPKYTEVTVTCSCGNSFVTKSTSAKDTMGIDICSQCHPFYTGKQRIVDTAGRVDKFKKRFGGIKKV
ncbi:50S ribosomal protein L31 [Francisella halioticida]|uniref:50S ribosomal protein L31 n=1 Tax=Francisella halioticida TaxID=549298 RepID=UPI001BB3D2C8|nr:50S ribosomal protein L31 [Francisella halioticida]